MVLSAATLVVVAGLPICSLVSFVAVLLVSASACGLCPCCCVTGAGYSCLFLSVVALVVVVGLPSCLLVFLCCRVASISFYLWPWCMVPVSFSCF
jgi:hypothetical protein